MNNRNRNDEGRWTEHQGGHGSYAASDMGDWGSKPPEQEQHHQQQRYGKPPKNYVRSDERIREDACESIMSYPQIDASDVEVTVERGEITLTGTVRDRRAKMIIEHALANVRGVFDIHNMIRLKREN